MNSISLKPKLNELYTLNEFILTELPEENLQVNLIVEEIFVNIVSYSKAEFVTVNVEYNSPALTIEFIDNGQKFNPLLTETLPLSDNIDEAQIGGLGIFLTKQLANELDYHYENGENHLKIIKKIEQ